MAPFAVLDFRGLNRPSANAKIFLCIVWASKVDDRRAEPLQSIVSRKSPARRKNWSSNLPQQRCRNPEPHDVLTKKRQETQAILLGTTFVGLFHPQVVEQVLLRDDTARMHPGRRAMSRRYTRGESASLPGFEGRDRSRTRFVVHELASGAFWEDFRRDFLLLML